MVNKCIFCKIADGSLPVEKVFEDENIVAFRDIRPEAPVHYVFIPKKHISSLNEICPEDAALIGDIHLKMKEVAEKEGFAEKGYRITANCGKDAGQVVFHVHFHLMAGRGFAWPPG